MGIWCNSCSSLGIYTLKVKNSNEQTFVFVIIRKTRSEIIRTNLFQNIDKIVKGFTKSSPLNRPAEIWCIKYRAPEMWLAWILNRLESITAILIKRDTTHLTIFETWPKVTEINVPPAFKTLWTPFNVAMTLNIVSGFGFHGSPLSTNNTSFKFQNQESHLIHKLQTLDHTGTIIISLKHQVKIPS